MDRKSVEVLILGWSVRVYRALLRAYPSRFQQEYGPHMLQVFRDCCVKASHQGRTNGMARLWAITLVDFLRSVFEQHLQRESYMSKAQLIKVGGWAFLLGSFGLAWSILGDSFAASVICSILLAVGTLSLRARYGEIAGGFAGGILLAGVIGTLLLYVGLAVLYLSRSMINLEGSRSFHPESLWILLWGGPAIVLLALASFGVAALRSKPMARFNWLPAFAGIWYPVIYFFMAGYLITNSPTYPAQYEATISAVMLIQFIALCVLGFILASDAPPELATA